MRIITGSARGTNLTAPEGLTTRPTSERAKMGVFNILQFEISGRRVLDLFAGSGQMGLEALSRGAAYAVFADINQDAMQCIQQNIVRTHMETRSRACLGDYKQILHSLNGTDPFDLIFLDPPYRANCLDNAVYLLYKNRLIANNAYIVCETDGIEVVPPPFLTIFKCAVYGKNHITILRMKEEHA